MPTKVCPSCMTEKPVTEYWMRKNRRALQPASRCKSCSNDANRQWRAANAGYEKARYAKQKVETRERHLVRKYGVDLAAYNEMLALQGGVCAICSKPESKEHHGVLHVDHCHSTGRVRGLLCRNCNHVLGLMRDDAALMIRAAEYLQLSQIPELIGRAILAAEKVQA